MDSLKITKSSVYASFTTETCIQIRKELIGGRMFIALYIDSSFMQREEIFSNTDWTQVPFAKSLIERCG